MLFRMQDEEFIDINRKDFSSSNEYYSALMDAYGVKMPYVGIRDDVIQLDYICSLIARQRICANNHLEPKQAYRCTHKSRL